MKIFTGIVIGVKSTKTATVAVERVVIHRLYGKRSKRIRKFQVHDEIGVKVGDRVKFADGKPVSKMKRWRITEVVVNKSKTLKK